MSWFKCSYPANSLFVDRDSTMGKLDEDFVEITHHLVCFKCGEKVDIGYSMMRKTVKEFLGISADKHKREEIEND